MVDLQRVRELAELMDEHELNQIRIREGDTVIDLRKGLATPAWPAPPPAPASPLAREPAAGGVLATTQADEALTTIRSPMVGSFYITPDPESPPFVSVGAEVEPDTTVCIIEAMKVFNEIKAEVAGTIERILVENEQAVEFGQPLMLVRPRS